MKDLEALPYETLVQVGKVHFLTLSLLEAAERDVKGLPKEVLADAKLVNHQAIVEISKSIEERRGEPERDIFLKEIASIFEPKKRRAKAKSAVKTSPALKRKKNAKLA